MLEGPELAASPQGLSVASGRSHPGGCTGAWGGQPLGQPAPAWTRLCQDRAGRKGQEERCGPPAAPPVGCSPSGVPEQLPLSKEKQVLNIRKPVSCSLPVWEPGVSRGRSVYVSGAARSCEAGLFFPAGRRFASAPPPPPGRRCLDFHLESLAQVPGVRDGLSPRTQLSPLSGVSLSWAPLYICPVGFGHVLSSGRATRGSRRGP